MFDKKKKDRQRQRQRERGGERERETKRKEHLVTRVTIFGTLIMLLIIL